MTSPELPPGAAMDIASDVYKEDLRPAPPSGQAFKEGFAAELERGWQARDELAKLRLSVARIAQALGVEDAVLLNAPEEKSRHVHRGWNALAAGCVSRATEVVTDLNLLKTTLAAYSPETNPQTPRLLEQTPEDIEGFNAATGHGAEGAIVGEHLLANGRRYRITESGLPYTPGEYPSGGLSIYVWHPAIENWSYVSNAPSEVEARAFLASAERLADEGTQWRQSDAPEA